jgi:Txe/YoeB family toxin of toxin-antitoxin system
MPWTIELTQRAFKDAEKLKSTPLSQKAWVLIALMQTNPYINPPSYEKLSGDLKGYYSRRINDQHRLVYEVLEEKRVIRIIRM